MDKLTEKRNENAEVIALKMFELMNKNIAVLSSLKIETDKEKADALNEQYREAINEIVQEVASLPYTIDELKYAINALELVVKSVSNSIVGTVEGNEIEILSRLYGKRNVNEKFDKFSATMPDIVLTLKELREKTGNDLMDYFS
jgi:hypothetical protein